MSVIMLSAEPSWRTGLGVHMGGMIFTQLWLLVCSDAAESVQDDMEATGKIRQPQEVIMYLEFPQHHQLVGVWLFMLVPGRAGKHADEQTGRG